jgi:hypothetical protein
MSGPNSSNDPVFFEDSPFDETPMTPGRATGSEGAKVSQGGLTVVCTLAIILAGTGLLTSCFGMISQVFASGMQQAFAGFPGGANQPGMDMQREMNARLMAVGNRYKSVIIPLMAVKIVVEAALLAGAIMSLKLKPRGRSWLRGALIAALVFEAIYAVPVILMQRETRAVMSEMMPKVMEAQQGANRAPPGVNDVMSTFFSAIGVVSMIVAVGWVVAKIVFYVLSLRCLGKPEVLALFGPWQATRLTE